MSNERKWGQVSAQSENQWKPQMTEKNGFKKSENKEDNQVQGYYLGCKPMKGKDGMFSVHTVHTVNTDGTLKDKTDFIGNKVLDDLLEQVKIGTFCCVVYSGRQHKKGNEGQAWSQTNSYHIWKLFQDSGAIPYNSIGGNATQQAANTTQTTNTNSAAPSGKVFDDSDELPF